MRRIPLLLAPALAAALTLTACGSDDNGTQSSDAAATTSSSAPAASFDDADVTFAQSMVPHHQQAVQMARMAKTHAASAEVKTLAADIEAAQGPEIRTMQGWLKSWGHPIGHEGHGMGGMDMGDMPGIMSDHAMRMLAHAHGAAWDRMFLQMMIRHHEGAIEMARTEKAKGQNPEAVALAEKIASTQQAEIAEMRSMLGS